VFPDIKFLFKIFLLISTSIPASCVICRQMSVTSLTHHCVGQRRLWTKVSYPKVLILILSTVPKILSFLFPWIFQETSNKTDFLGGFVVPCIFKYSIKHPTRCTINLIFIALLRRYRSKCFGHCCAHHQELPPTAFAASGYRMIARLDQPGNHTVTRGCKGSWNGS
jgi:hypothetical protein